MNPTGDPLRNTARVVSVLLGLEPDAAAVSDEQARMMLTAAGRGHYAELEELCDEVIVASWGSNPGAFVRIGGLAARAGFIGALADISNRLRKATDRDGQP